LRSFRNLEFFDAAVVGTEQLGQLSRDKSFLCSLADAEDIGLLDLVTGFATVLSAITNAWASRLEQCAQIGNRRDEDGVAKIFVKTLHAGGVDESDIPVGRLQRLPGFSVRCNDVGAFGLRLEIE